METVVYLIRHAQKADDSLFNSYNVLDSNREKDERKILTIDGEKKSLELAKMEIFDNIDIIYSSHFSRCIGTAKYMASKLNMRINIDSRLGERNSGLLERNISSDKMFYYNTTHDFDYKINDGESLNEVRKRMEEVFKEIVDMNLGKQIAIFSHNTAIFSLLLCYCEVGYNLDDELILTYDEDLSFPFEFSSPEIIKLTLLEKEVVKIERIII